MKYKSRQHVIESAQAAGSSAKTFKGAARYLVGAAHNTLATLDLVNARTRITVPLGTESRDEVSAPWREAHPRRQNWDAPKPSQAEKQNFLDEINHGRYSSKCTFTHWTYQPVVTSFANILNQGRTLQWHWGKEEPIRWKAPRGYRFDRDANGLRIVSLSDQRKDYHPDSDDLRGYSSRALAKKASELFATRQAEAKKAREEMRIEKLSADERTRLIAKAEREGALICMQDALKAGNCRTGVENFASRHKLDTSRHYKPSQLLRIANGDATRVKLAVAVGLRRHRHEMQVGYALLEDHRC